MYKVASIVCCLVIAASALIPEHGYYAVDNRKGPYDMKSDVEYYAYPVYKVEYVPNDPNTGEHQKGQTEEREAVKEQYKIVEENGTHTLIPYVDNDHGGFNEVLQDQHNEPLQQNYQQAEQIQQVHQFHQIPEVQQVQNVQGVHQFHDDPQAQQYQYVLEDYHETPQNQKIPDVEQFPQIPETQHVQQGHQIQHPQQIYPEYQEYPEYKFEYNTDDHKSKIEQDGGDNVKGHYQLVDSDKTHGLVQGNLNTVVQSGNQEVQAGNGYYDLNSQNVPHVEHKHVQQDPKTYQVEQVPQQQYVSKGPQIQQIHEVQSVQQPHPVPQNNGAAFSEYYSDPVYNFEYKVNDETTRDHKTQTVESNGDIVKGHYKLVEADGASRLVKYTANDQDNHSATIPHQQIQKSVEQVQPQETVEYNSHPIYKSEYRVNNPTPEDHRSQTDVRKGDVVKGHYTLIESNGVSRLVDYSGTDMPVVQHTNAKKEPFQKIKQVEPQIQQATPELNSHPVYKFEQNVNNATVERNEDVVKGHYTLIESNGVSRLVDYTGNDMPVVQRTNAKKDQPIQKIKQVQPQTQQAIPELNSYPVYKFEQSVNNATTGDQKSQTEERNGDVVKGHYILIESNGVSRLVEYTGNDMPVVQRANVQKDQPIQKIKQVQPQIQQAIPELNSYPMYKFEHSVKNSTSGDQKSQTVERNGDVVKGYYTLVETNGVKRLVQYTGNDQDGFNTIVQRPIVQKDLGNVQIQPPQPKKVEQVPHIQESFPEFNSHPVYKFEYTVNDANTGDHKSQSEERNGDIIKGHYSLVEADGESRLVPYDANDQDGFNAVVQRPHAQNDPKVPELPKVLQVKEMQQVSKNVEQNQTKQRQQDEDIQRYTLVLENGVHKLIPYNPDDHKGLEDEVHHIELPVQKEKLNGKIFMVQKAPEQPKIQKVEKIQEVKVVKKPKKFKIVKQVQKPKKSQKVQVPQIQQVQEVQKSYGAPFPENNAHPDYRFEYKVNDPSTGDHKSQTEERNGNDVKGQYSLVESDGTSRLVQYTAISQDGFRAVVQKIGKDGRQIEAKKQSNVPQQQKYGQNMVYADTYPKYRYEYSVNDTASRDVKNHWEERNGNNVKGAYSLNEADGSKRVVQYTSNDDGFMANVQNISRTPQPAVNRNKVEDEQQIIYFVEEVEDDDEEEQEQEEPQNHVEQQEELYYPPQQTQPQKPHQLQQPKPSYPPQPQIQYHSHFHQQQGPSYPPQPQHQASFLPPRHEYRPELVPAQHKVHVVHPTSKHTVQNPIPMSYSSVYFEVNPQMKSQPGGVYRQQNQQKGYAPKYNGPSSSVPRSYVKFNLLQNFRSVEEDHKHHADCHCSKYVKSKSCHC